MSWELMAQMATVASAVAVVGGFVVAYILFQKQANVDVFLEYTKRFHKVMSAFPREAWEARLSQESLPEESKELRMVVLEYLNLCSEEYYCTSTDSLMGRSGASGKGRSSARWPARFSFVSGLCSSQSFNRSLYFATT